MEFEHPDIHYDAVTLKEGDYIGDISILGKDDQVLNDWASSTCFNFPPIGTNERTEIRVTTENDYVVALELRAQAFQSTLTSGSLVNQDAVQTFVEDWMRRRETQRLLMENDPTFSSKSFRTRNRQVKAISGLEHLVRRAMRIHRHEAAIDEHEDWHVAQTMTRAHTINKDNVSGHLKRSKSGSFRRKPRQLPGSSVVDVSEEADDLVSYSLSGHGAVTMDTMEFDEKLTSPAQESILLKLVEVQALLTERISALEERLDKHHESLAARFEERLRRGAEDKASALEGGSEGGIDRRCSQDRRSIQSIVPKLSLAKFGGFGGNNLTAACG